MIFAAAADAAPYHADHHHADLAWKTLETRFFRIHYAVSKDPRSPRRVDTSGTAARLAAVADRLLLGIADHAGTIARGPVHVLVSDHAEGMTAFTLPQWGWIVLSADPGTEVLRLRGRLDWAEDALAHELGHLVGHRKAQALALGVATGAELEGVAEHGPVGVGVELPIGPTEPYGWSEGAAEAWSEAIGVNRWTSARDAMLRTSALEGRLLDWDEWLVAVDKGDALDAERAYQQGYAFARWLAEREGRDVFVEMAAIASERYRPSWRRVLERAVGTDARELWAEWRASVTVDAVVEAARIRADGVAEGEAAERTLGQWRSSDPRALERWRGRDQREQEEVREASGTWELWPRTSPDGRWYAEGRVGWVRIVRTGASTFPGIAGAELDWDATVDRRLDTDRNTSWVPATFGSTFAFVPGRDAVVVAAPEDADRDGSWLPERSDRWSRLWLVDLAPEVRDEDGGPVEVLDLSTDRGRRRRMTPIAGTLRARDPAVSPGGRRLAWLAYDDGTTNLVVADLDGRDPRRLSSFDDGTWLASPSWSPDGDHLVVSAFREGRGDLWSVRVADGEWTRLTDDPVDELDPVWADDGIWFAADPTGVAEVYRLVLPERRFERMTRVVGGAACPNPTPAGDLLYTATTAYGLQAMAIARDELLFEPVTWGSAPDEPPPPPALPPEPRRYHALRSVLPPVISPIVRIDFPDRPVPLGGAYVRARDAAERLDLALTGLAGEDLFGHARLTWRGLPPEVTVWTTGELDRRVLPGPTLDRRGVGAVGAVLSQRWRDDVRLEARGTTLALWTHGDPAPQLRSDRLGVAVVAGRERELSDAGLSVDLEVLRGASAVLPDPRYAWARGLLHADGTTGIGVRSGPLDEHRHRLEGTLDVGATSRDLHPAEELVAGGDVPGALRLGVVEASVPFPGYPPFSIRGELLAVGGLRWVVPIAPRIRAGGGAFYVSGIEAAAGGDVGNAWSVRLDPPETPVLADAVAEVRLRALLFDSRWDSVLRAAWGLSEQPRVTIGLGTGF